MHKRSWISLRITSGLDSITFQRLDHFVRIEILHSHTNVIDAGLTAGASATEHEELNSSAYAHQRSTRSLIGLNLESEYLLIELIRSRRIGNKVRRVTPT